LADISVLNGALLVEHNVALYLERCSGSVGSIDMDHCICNAPMVSLRQLFFKLLVTSAQEVGITFS